MGLRLHGLATVVDEFVGELNPAIFEDHFHEVLFYGCGGFAAG